MAKIVSCLLCVVKVQMFLKKKKQGAPIFFRASFLLKRCQVNAKVLLFLNTLKWICSTFTKKVWTRASIYVKHGYLARLLAPLFVLEPFCLAPLGSSVLEPDLRQRLQISGNWRKCITLTLKQCWGSVTFWCGSVSGSPDPIPYFGDFKNAKNNFFSSYYFL